MLAVPDDEVRRAVVRALNTYYAEVYAGYRDRLEPVAVIPTFTPEEAVEELDYAVGTLGLKAVVMNGVIPRSTRPDGSAGAWVDTLGHGSVHDYDPLWARCVELGVAPAFHGVGYGWGSRVSPTNYVYNHLGNFAAAQEAACRSLVMGGVTRRFPDLHFAFLEGGVAWAAQLYADLLGHYEKRNTDVVGHVRPPALRPRPVRAAPRRVRHRSHRRAAATATSATRRRPRRRRPPTTLGFDDFAESLVTAPEQIVDIFTRQFHFGCEADDALNALAFDRRVLPHGATAPRHVRLRHRSLGRARHARGAARRRGSWSTTGLLDEASSATSRAATSCTCSPPPTPTSSPAPRWPRPSG